MNRTSSVGDDRLLQLTIDDDVTGTLSAKAEDTTAIPFPNVRLTDFIEGDAHIADPETATDEVPPPKTGDRIAGYRLQEQLGQGVSCFVFRGWDEAKQLPVAVKIVNWNNVYDREAALKQLRTEAAALSRIKHSRVVRFIDFGFDSRWPYLALEFIEGRSLGELVRSGGAMPPDWTVYIMSQIVDGLGAIWKASIVHRDLKPDNILIGPNGVAKIVDFGVAKSDVLRLAEVNPKAELAGTAAYIAPEQAKDAGAVDLRADIYSLGITFYETLTGRLPFDAKNRVQMIFHHMSTPVPPPNEVNPEVPQLLSDVCLWMLAKNPDERPQTYDDLRAAFNTVMHAMNTRA